MKLHRILLFLVILFHEGIVWSKSDGAPFFETFDVCEEETNNLTSLMESPVKSSHPDTKMETYDITETLLSNPPNISNQFYFNLKNMFETWVPSVKNSILQTINITLEHDNKSIVFSNIIIAEYYASSNISLNCEFSEYLQIKIPGKESKLKFRGDVYTNENDDKMATGQFAITINEICFTIMAHKDSSDVKIDINYKNFTVESNIKSDHRSITTQAMAASLEKLKSNLKSTIKQNFGWTANRTSPNAFLIMYDVCMHPKSRIVQAHPAFASSEKYYYFTTQPYSGGWKSIKLSQGTIKTYAYGLSNYKSLKIDGNFRYGEYSRFTFSLHSLHGYANWSHGPPLDLHQFHILRFKIDSITVTFEKRNIVTRDIYINDLSNVNIKLTPSVACVQLNDSLASFGRALLLGIIEESISLTITAAF